jgi:hypothetical protein
MSEVTVAERFGEGRWLSSLPLTAATLRQFLLDRWELGEAMSNTIYNQQRNLKRHLKRLEVARQLNAKVKRKSTRMLKVIKRVSPGPGWNTASNVAQCQFDPDLKDPMCCLQRARERHL